MRLNEEWKGGERERDGEREGGGGRRLGIDYKL